MTQATRRTADERAGRLPCSARWLAIAAALLLAGCAAGPGQHSSVTPAQPGPVASPTVAKPAAKRKGAGEPNPPVEAARKRVGEATYYASYFEGRPTASGEPYDSQAMTAAHKTLPFGTQVKVTALDSGASTVVTINDRGPFVEGRIIDLSEKAAE
ncbi:septal ring lytic transglycosylase RlpA family protein, partial [Salinicola rhizosphaerae]|uniref:septal ring lytic transglycosylase RlpA family protein n=1 Tax=Salinicola rhizosphaerae TaxID=1443141 RepID=UPI0027E4F62F